MRILKYVLIVPALFGCGQAQRPSSVERILEYSASKKLAASGVKELVLPSGFRLDTIQKFDSARDLSIFILLPISGVNKIDKVLYDEICKQKSDFVQTLDDIIKRDSEVLNSANGSDFTAEPISVYKGGKVTSVLFGVSYSHGGAAHPMSSYYSLTFDNSTLKRILFSDFFRVKTTADTLYITNLITKAIGREGIYVSTLENIDFNVENDTISFNFDDYEIASYSDGLIRGRLSKTQIIDKITSIYR